jgi:hypothetical protein
MCHRQNREIYDDEISRTTFSIAGTVIVIAADTVVLIVISIVDEKTI